MAKKPAINPWLIAFTVSLATFMEVLDTSIANVALPHIAGSLAIGPDQQVWVLTSYLISNAIIIPISGWLAVAIGRKRFYMICVALFTVSSVLCGMAPNIETLLVLRVIQGIGGGGLAPCEQSILTDTFPPEKLGQAFAFYAMAVVVAPAIGPGIGGWLTDNYSWRWIFFINAPVGILSLILVHFLVQDSPQAKAAHQKEIRGGLRIDYMGFAFTCLAFGALQVVLDKGQEDDWFGSNFILTLTILSVIGLIGLIVWETTVAKNPIVDLPLLASGNMLSSFFLMGVMGFILQASTVLLPQFAQEVLDYDATNAGNVLLLGGAVLVVSAIMTGQLITHIQPKYLAATGALFVGWGMYKMTQFSTSTSYWEMVHARLIQCIGLPMFFVSIQTVAYANLPKGKTDNASALINLMRIFGGSVGVSVATVILTRRETFHQSHLVSNLQPSSDNYQRWLDESAGRAANAVGSAVSGGGVGGGSATAGQGPVGNIMQGVAGGQVPFTRELRRLYEDVSLQANVLSYIDAFKVMEVSCIIVFFLLLLTRPVRLGKAAPA